MSETAVLESQPVEMDVSRGPLVNLTSEERAEYKKTGELPTTKKEASSPSAERAESAPAKSQEAKHEPKPKQTAEERIAQLESTIEKIKKGAGIEKPKPAEPAPAKPQPVSQQTAKPTPDDKKADGTPKYETHAEYEDALMDWKIDQRESERAAKAQETARLAALNDKVEKARERYGDVDAVIEAAGNEIYEDTAIPLVVKQMIGDSDLMVDLIFTIAKEPAELAKFQKMARETPGKAIRYIALTESLIAQELDKHTSSTEEPAPAKPRTQAPKPPSEAGGRAATPPDSLQAALEGSGGKLNAGLKAEFLRRDLARLKG